MKNVKVLILCIIFLFLSLNLIFGLTVKLGSLVPVGSPWDDSLKQMAAEWKKVSNGKVILKIYPGGIAGDEEDMIRKIRIGQLNASAMTAIGLSRIFKGILSIQLPFISRNRKELSYAFEKMKPYFEENLEKKGFKLLLWSDAGWAYFFSRKPVVKPQDLKDQKLFLWEGDADMVKTWAEMGFDPVPLAATEIMTSLQSGMIDALMTSPLTAASYQWFGIAKNMCKMELAPFIGGIVISTRTWKRIPPDLRVKLMKVTQEVGKEMLVKTSKAEKKAVIVMKKYGLKIHHVPGKIQKKWRKIANEGYEKLMGKSIHKESYEKVKAYITEYRNKQ